MCIMERGKQHLMKALNRMSISCRYQPNNNQGRICVELSIPRPRGIIQGVQSHHIQNFFFSGFVRTPNNLHVFLRKKPKSEHSCELNGCTATTLHTAYWIEDYEQPVN